MTWIFGGELLATPARRSLTTRDQLDLTLIRPDGTLHGVELKLARISRLVPSKTADCPAQVRLGTIGRLGSDSRATLQRACAGT